MFNLFLLITLCLNLKVYANILPCNGTDDVANFINTQYSLGLSSGNYNDWYYNLDNYHAFMSTKPFNQINWVSFSLMNPSFDTYPGKKVIGNASIAYKTENYGFWTSVARYYFMRNSYYANKVYQQYISNTFFWYPEHLDHDTTDYYHGNIPYCGNSQGSSGSELDEVQKCFYILASFRPDTKKKLMDTGLLIPTLVMILRRTRVNNDDEYLSGIAHPMAFDNCYSSHTLACVKMANEMLPSEIPPMVQLNVIEDTFNAENGIDFFETNGKTENCYISPCSISMIFRSRDYTKYIVVSATGSYDVNNRPLTYHWKILRGDPSKIRFIYLNPERSKVRIEVDYHTTEPFYTREGVKKFSNRVDIGVFVNNGIYYSAPGFITSYTIFNEKRIFDNKKNVTEIEYGTQYKYTPVSIMKSWVKDVFFYDEHNLLSGFIRYSTSSINEYTAEGLIVDKKDLNGKVTTAKEVSYVANCLRESPYFDILDIETKEGWQYEFEYKYISTETLKKTPIYVNSLDQITSLKNSSFTVSILRKPKKGSLLSFYTTGYFIYTPSDDFTGWDSFALKILNYTASKSYVIRCDVKVGNTYIISGNVYYKGKPLPAVNIECANNMVTTNAQGYYEFDDLIESSYTIIPFLSGFSFDPSSVTIYLSNSISRVDFNASIISSSTFFISGYIKCNGLGIPNVLIKVGNYLCYTNNEGFYIKAGLVGGNYIVTPFLKNYVFEPTQKTLFVDRNIENLDFVAYNISDFSGVKVYPNPVKKGGILKFKGINSSSNVKIYTIDGKLVKEVNFSQDQENIDLKDEDNIDMSAGTYIYILTSERKEVKKGKFVIIH